MLYHYPCYYKLWLAELQCFFNHMKKHITITIILSLFFVMLYLLWLFFTVVLFMPDSGYRIFSRAVAEDSILIGRDNPDTRNAKRELLPGEQIDINTADADTLQLLSGIGPSLSTAIIEYRLENGPFESIEELMLVPGIGEKKFTAVRDYITIGGNE